jgi:hypothetical protein
MLKETNIGLVHTATTATALIKLGVVEGCGGSDETGAIDPSLASSNPQMNGA